LKPPPAEDRLQLLTDGRVRVERKPVWRD